MPSKAEGYEALAAAVALLEDEGCDVLDSNVEERPIGGIAAAFTEMMGGKQPTEPVLELTIRPGDLDVEQPPYPEPPTAEDLQDDVDESEVLASVLRSIYGDNPQAPPEDMDAGVLLDKLASDEHFHEETIGAAVARCGWMGFVDAEWAKPQYWGGED